MQNRIKILGVSIDKIRLDKLMNKTQIYLNQDSFHVIYLAGMKTVLRAEEDEQFATFLEQCDCMIAGAKAMEEQVYEKPLAQDHKLLAQHYLERLLAKMNKNHTSLYLIGNNQTELDEVMDLLSRSYENIVYNASCLEEETKEDAIDFIVNDINVVAPEVMFILMDGEQTREFVEENRVRMNVKVCICIGEVDDEILPQMSKKDTVPNWVAKLGLTSMYQKLFPKRNIHYTMLNRMFQKKIREQECQKEQKENKKV